MIALCKQADDYVRMYVYLATYYYLIYTRAEMNTY